MIKKQSDEKCAHESIFELETYLRNFPKDFAQYQNLADRYHDNAAKKNVWERYIKNFPLDTYGYFEYAQLCNPSEKKAVFNLWKKNYYDISNYTFDYQLPDAYQLRSLFWTCGIKNNKEHADLLKEHADLFKKRKIKSRFGSINVPIVENYERIARELTQEIERELAELNPQQPQQQAGARESVDITRVETDVRQKKNVPNTQQVQAANAASVAQNHQKNAQMQ